MVFIFMCGLYFYVIPCHLSKRVEYCVPVVGFLLVMVTTRLNKLYDYVLALKMALDTERA